MKYRSIRERVRILESKVFVQVEIDERAKELNELLADIERLEEERKQDPNYDPIKEQEMNNQALLEWIETAESQNLTGTNQVEGSADKAPKALLRPKAEGYRVNDGI